MSAVWQEQLDVVTEFAGWSDEELFAAWVQRTRVVRGLDADPATGQLRAVPDITAPRGVWTARVRELVHAVQQAYLCIDTPAPADPEFCGLFLGAFGGVSGDSLLYRAEGEGAELPEPPPAFDDAATPDERVRLHGAHELREQRRRSAAARRSWRSVWSGLTYVGGGDPAVVSMQRTWIDWNGALQARSLDSVDVFLQRGGDIGAHRWSGEPMTPAPGARVSSPWTGGDLFVRHECALRMDAGDCTRWQDEVFPAPAMEWRLWSEIADALERRSATDVMRDAWRWTTARNVAQLLASGLATSEVTDMIGQADIAAAEIQQNNDIREIARWTSIIGDAAMAAGPYGAIVGAVLKAIAAILEAVPVAYGVGLDVWERRTPAFSTHRLTGRPGRAPTQTLERPPGFGRALRGRLQILYPVMDATRLRVKVNDGVWRPHHWEDEVPIGENGYGEYQVDVEQPGRVPSRITARVRAGELTVVQLQPLRRIQTQGDRERQMRQADEDAEADKVLAEKLRQMEAERQAAEQKPSKRPGPKGPPSKSADVETPVKGPPSKSADVETPVKGADANDADATRETSEEPERPSPSRPWLKRGAVALGLSALGYAGWRAVRWARRRDDDGRPMDQGAHELVTTARNAGRAGAVPRTRVARDR